MGPENVDHNEMKTSRGFWAIVICASCVSIFNQLCKLFFGHFENILTSSTSSGMLQQPKMSARPPPLIILDHCDSKIPKICSSPQRSGEKDARKTPGYREPQERPQNGGMGFSFLFPGLSFLRVTLL